MSEDRGSLSNEQGGIVVISALDPLSQFWKLVTGSHFTLIGFYSSTSRTGVKKNLITVVDAYNLNKPSWIPINTTLDQLMTFPLISSIKLRPIKDRGLIPKLKSAIAQVSESIKPLTIDQVLDNVRKVRRTSLPGQKFINGVMSLVIYGQIKGFHSSDLDKYFEDLDPLRLPTHSLSSISNSLRALPESIVNQATVYLKHLITTPIPTNNHPGTELLINIDQDLPLDTKSRSRLKIFLGMREDKKKDSPVCIENTDICVLPIKQEPVNSTLSPQEIEEISTYLNFPTEG